jgi:hypothetical protein
MGRLGEFINLDPYQDKRGMLKKIIKKSQLSDRGSIFALLKPK